jgi:iron(III) transport system ATP-binding protein
MFDAAARLNVPPERRGVSMVFQSYAIWPHMTVFENVAYGPRARGVASAAVATAVNAALDLVGLAAFADRPAPMLSGGQQQRVALARALACDPSVVLFDEPLSNLDTQLRLAMRGELASLRRRLGFTALYVTHDQEEAFALSDRILVLRDGRIEQAGTPAALHAAPRSRFVASFLGMRNVLHAEAKALSGNQAEARLPDGTILRAANPWPAPPESPSLCVRPIDVTLSLTETEGQGGQGTIAQMLFLGDLMHITLRCDGYELVASTRPRDDLAERMRVHWRAAPQSCLVTWF